VLLCLRLVVLVLTSIVIRNRGGSLCDIMKGKEGNVESVMCSSNDEILVNVYFWLFLSYL
jgi:hypothetical protein